MYLVIKTYYNWFSGEVIEVVGIFSEERLANEAIEYCKKHNNDIDDKYLIKKYELDTIYVDE